MHGAVARTILAVVTALALIPAALAGPAPSPASAGAGYRTLGQPALGDESLASRCSDPNARFNFLDDGGFEMHGPSGITVDAKGRLFVTDFGGLRVMMWPKVDGLASCAPATIIGAGNLVGPEAVVFDEKSRTLFVADTLNHVVHGFRQAGKTWSVSVTLGTFAAGNGADQFNFPRGLAVDDDGRLFVADDFNNRVQIFAPPFNDGDGAVDSIGAAANGGFSHPKGLALVGETLFVADYDNNRVLRFTGPFNTPDQVYTATATFTGVTKPVDVAISGMGGLLVTQQETPAVKVFLGAAWWDSDNSPDTVYTEFLGPEPLGVATDRLGGVYMADYRHYRVLIREERTIRAPVDPKATAATKALLANLHARGTRASDRTAIGQHLLTYEYGPKSSTKAWYGDWLQMKRKGLPLPKVMGGELSDLMSYPGFSPNRNARNEMIRFGKAGGIITLTWHPQNPTGGPFGQPITVAQIQQMSAPNTAIGKAWRTQLNRAALVLKQFANAGVPVLFRPLHEQNGDFFWWGHDRSGGQALYERQQAWVGMWQDMVLYMTEKKGLHNLLFVFGTNQVNYSDVTAPLTYYPGGFWADAVSIDVYDEQLDLAGNDRGRQHYAALVSTGKPFGIAEFGQTTFDNGTGPNGEKWDARTLTRRIRDSYPRTAWAAAWYSSVEGGAKYVYALPDVAFTKQMLNDRLIETE